MPDKSHIAEIDRALARHDANALYTLIREVVPQGQAGRIMYELIKTQHDWPTPRKNSSEHYHAILTPTELKVLRYAEQGHGVTETAHLMPLGIETVKSHRYHILHKLGVENMAEAIHLGHELGFFSESHIAADELPNDE